LALFLEDTPWGATGEPVKTIQRRRSGNGVASAEKKNVGRPAKVKEVPQLVEGLTAGHAVEHVALQDIDLTDKTWQFRISLRVKDLAESIQTSGQQIPVILRRISGQEALQVISGFRRLTAIQSIGWPTAHAIVLDDVGDEAAFRLSVLENEKRKTYTDLDRAHAITKYRQMGYKVADIAENIFGLSRKQVERLQVLTELPDFMQEAIAEDRLPTTQALILKQLHDKHGKDNVDLASWTDKAASDTLSVRELRAAVLNSISAKPAVLSVFSSSQKDGATVIRLKAIKLDLASLTDDHRFALAADLEALLARVRV
jgi:ParB/RepB/Spo0J family partition protein